MKLKRNWIILAICSLSLVALGIGAVKKIEKEANISLASSNLRSLTITWREFKKEHSSRSPESLNELIQWASYVRDLLTFEGKPRCRAEEIPKIIYHLDTPLDLLDPATPIMSQKWSDDVYLIALASSEILRQKSVEP